MSPARSVERSPAEVRHRRRTRLVTVVVLLVVVAAGVLWVWLGRGEGDWERYVKEVEARGDTLDWKAYLPPPPPPDAENFAANSVLRAAGIKGQRTTNPSPALLDLRIKPALGETGDWTKGGPADLTKAVTLIGATPSGAAKPTRSEAAYVLLAAFAPAQAEIEELRRAGLRRGAKLDLAYPDPVSMSLPDYVVLRETAQMFTLLASAEVELGRMDEAFADIRVVHRLADTVQPEPNLVSAMICVAIHGLAPQAFWEGWAEGKWSDPQLAAFQERFERIELLPLFDRAIRGERAGFNQIMSRFSGRQMAQTFGTGGTSAEDRVMRFLMRLMPGGLYRSNQLFYNRLLDRTVFRGYDVAAGRVFPRLAASGAAEINNAISRPNPRNFLVRAAMPNTVRALETAARNQMRIRMAALACMLERHRRAKGGYPERLEELMPEFAARLPIDLTTGRPPVYRRTDGGRFVLYCPGWDEVDDGGDPSKDWVWPMGQGAGR